MHYFVMLQFDAIYAMHPVRLLLYKTAIASWMLLVNLLYTQPFSPKNSLGAMMDKLICILLKILLFVKKNYTFS